MYNIGVHNRVNQVFGVFDRFGLWCKNDEIDVRKFRKKLFYFTSYVAFVLSLAVAALTSDLKEESVYLAESFILCSVMLVRLFFILCKREEILAFIKKIALHSIEDYEEFIGANNKLNKFIKLVSVFTFLVTVAVFLLLLLPVFSNFQMLPFNIWFPLDYKSNNRFGYWMAYSFAVYGCVLSYVFLLFEFIIWYIMINCVVKYQLLQNQFRRLGAVPSVKTIETTEISETEKENLFLRDLIAAIKNHQDIKNSTDHFITTFSNLFFVQLATSAISICGSVYILAFSCPDNLFQVAIYIVILLYSLLDAFVVMYLGNEIQLGSDRLSYCLFESNWIEQSKSCRKCIVILMEVLKQPQILVIWKLYPLNLETFMRILHGAYSMFNILQNLH